jgi:hypothetical protein
MKTMQLVSWLYLGVTALLCLAVAFDSPLLDASSATGAQDGESLGLLVWLFFGVLVGVYHDQSSIARVPRVQPWRLVAGVIYSAILAGALSWLNAVTDSSGTAPSSAWQAMLGVSVAWVLFCAAPWLLGRWAARVAQTPGL